MTEENLLINENNLPSFEELLALVEELQVKIESISANMNQRRFGNSEYQDKDIFITKGIVSVGSNDDVMIISGLDPLYRLWAGNRDPALANFTIDKDGNLISVGGEITGGTITGGTIQTAATGKRLVMAGSPANQYQFYDGATSVGYLKIDDDGAGGYFAQIFIDHLGAAIEVGSTVGAAEITYFNAPGFSFSGRAAVGSVFMDAKGFTFGMEWSGGGDPYLITDALPTSDPGVTGALWNDAGYVAVSP